MSEVKKSPIWLQAVADLIAGDHKPGSIITRDWLLQQFELVEPDTVPAYKRFELQFLGHFESFRRKLLEEHCLDLRNIPGTGGYTIVPAPHQTSLAMQDFCLDFRRVFRKAFRRIKFVNHEALTTEQRQENTDAATRLSQVQGLTAPKRWLTTK